ncbi:MAG: amidohydrolase family protein [Betaproteobacteria bacterium]|nr:amidohydrolase family protein [Betaproteobacteria bacterium]MDH3437336.1 amidohydrolase family protein [Betaproteobacteria bacterium]
MKTIAAPDPNPVTPKYVPPPGACDAHCHVFGPGARFPYAPERRYTPPDAPKEKLAALHRHLGFTRAVLVQASCHGHDNSAMLDAMSWSKGAWRGVAMLGDDVTERELERLHAGGTRGVRFNFVRHLGGAPDLQVIEHVVARIRPLGWHLQVHLDAEDIAAYSRFLDRLPVPFIIDHMGRVEAGRGLEQKPFRQLLELVKSNERAWVKVSGADRVSFTSKPFHDALPFARALIEVAPDRVLWGTDFPHPNANPMPNDGELVDLFAAFCPDELRHCILVDNPTRLYWPETL